jgi:hypothetical protein
MSNTSVAPVGVVQLRQQEIFAESVFQYFTEKELMAVRLVSTCARDAAERYLWDRFTSFSGASSLIPSQMNRETLKKVIMRKLQEGGTHRLAADQITSASFMNSLLGPRMTIKINVGSTAPKEGLDKIPNARQIQGPYDGPGKAHAKFISGGGGVLVTSANPTPTALSGKTVESLALIQSLRVKAYFNRYFELMRSRTATDERMFREMVQAFNSTASFMSLALAPFIEIQPWLLAEVEGSTRLIIRMFLISNLRRGNDIIEGLNDMARRNPRMTIDVYVDEGQINNSFTEYFDHREREMKRNYYVHGACMSLMRGAPNVRVFQQSGPDGIMHDKLILAETDLVSPTGVNWTHKRVILGSSGFSTNVMTNSNWEIMVRMDDVALYDYMMRHHNQSLNPKSGVKTSLLS